MSFKGLKKTIVRTPQNFRQKFNIGEVTTDPVYQDAERRFKELELETKKLSSESKRYFGAVNGILDNQIDFSKAIAEIYKPISGRLSDPNSTIQEDNPEGIKASESYQEVVKQLKETLQPDLELIEKRIVEPAQELLKVIQNIRKMAVKRDHKQVDLDRHKRNYNKYESKKERSTKDEERMYGAEADVEVAQQEYDYYNDMLKQELPILFQMQSDFIRPLFVSFYYMQLNIFYTLYSAMEELKIPYFDLNSDIVEAYTFKRGNIEEQTDAIGITHFKVGHAKNKLEMTRRRHQLAQEGEMSPSSPSTPAYGTYGAYGQPPVQPGQSDQLPAYNPGFNPPQQYGDVKTTAGPGGAPTYGGYGDVKTTAGPGSTPAYGGYGQPQTPVSSGYPTPASTSYAVPGSAPGVAGGVPGLASPPASYGANAAASSSPQTCTALYDYAAQAQGDLSFTAGAVIEIVQKTNDANGWWTGKFNGQTGVFPGNYVQLN